MRYKRMLPDTPTPEYQTDGAGAFDLKAVWRKDYPDYIEYGTGLMLEIPLDHLGILNLRSSSSDMDMYLANEQGWIDADYRGEIKVRMARKPRILEKKFDVLKNFIGRFVSGACRDKHEEWRNVDKVLQMFEDEKKEYQVGDRIAQLMIVKVLREPLKESQMLNMTRRGEGGFGSTGR